MTKRILLLFLPLLFIFSSCGENHVYYSDKIFDNFKWAHSDKLISSIDMQSVKKPYDIWFTVKHYDNYPFENIYLRISDDFTGSELIDTISINLSDNYGIWKGEKSGKTFEFKTLLRKSHKFPKPGKYNIKIEQFTRADSLSGVGRIGFFVDEVKVQ